MAKGPGKNYREGLTLLQVADMFSVEEEARQWLEEQLWPEGPFCPFCGSFDVQCNIKHNTMTHRCRTCPTRRMFTLRKGTVMEGTKMSYRVWAIGIYLFMTNIKGISSMRLHRELGIGQKAAWFMLQRLRKATEMETGLFSGPVEVDEAYFGGREKNKHADKKLHARGATGKTAVVGTKDRDTNQVAAQVVQDTTKETLHGIVMEKADANALVFTDEHQSYQGLPFDHATVKHSVSEYVNGMAHINGMESFWALLKRGYHGTYHKVSPKHLNRYVSEFATRHNVRQSDTIDQMRTMVRGMAAKRLRYADLIADNGLGNGARS